VTPMEVIKIRLQAQHHSMADPLDIPKYRNAAHALYTVLKEEGAGALYRGVSLTALRQGMISSHSKTHPSPLNPSNPNKLTTTRIQPSSKLHSLLQIQRAPPKMATRIQLLTSPLLPNNTNRSRLRGHGSPLQRTHRHHQDASAEGPRYARRDGPQ